MVIKVRLKSFFSQTDFTSESEEGEAIKPPEARLLKGIMRVGLLAKNLLLKADKQVIFKFFSLHVVVG